MVQRMAVHVGVNAAEMLTFEVGKIQVLQPRPAKAAVGRGNQLLAVGVVNHQRPLTVGLDPDNLVGQGQPAVFGPAG